MPSPRINPTTFWPPLGNELPLGVMAEYRLTERARADLIGIYDFTDELAAGYRRLRFQSHLIFYTVQIDGVEIRAVVHAAQDIRPQLFD